MSTNNNLPQFPQNPESPAPFQNLHRAIDSTIDQLLAYKALLIKAQLAGVEYVDLEHPDTGQLYRTSIALAIEAVVFASDIKKAQGGE